MKYIILLGDGMADLPLEELGGKTPLEYAHTPYMDKIAKEGTLGMIDTIPAGFSPGSDVAIMSLLGYDPVECYTGRGPLEAANMGVQLGADDVAFRCNLVTLRGNAEYIMEDFTAGHITTEEAKRIINDINNDLGSSDFQFYPGVSYRHLLVWRNGKADLETTPPHDITGNGNQGLSAPGRGDGRNKKTHGAFAGFSARSSRKPVTHSRRQKAGKFDLAMGAGKGAEICQTDGQVWFERGHDISRRPFEWHRYLRWTQGHARRRRNGLCRY